MANAKNSQDGPVFGHRENKGACRPAASIQKSTTVYPQQRKASRQGQGLSDLFHPLPGEHPQPQKQGGQLDKGTQPGQRLVVLPVSAGDGQRHGAEQQEHQQQVFSPAAVRSLCSQLGHVPHLWRSCLIWVLEISGVRGR